MVYQMKFLKECLYLQNFPDLWDIYTMIIKTCLLCSMYCEMYLYYKTFITSPFHFLKELVALPESFVLSIP